MAIVTTKENDEYDDNEAVARLLYSRGWDVIVRRMFREKLNDWKRMLLTNQTLDESKRNGYILARQTILEAVQAQYKKHHVPLPNWLEE